MPQPRQGTRSSCPDAEEAPKLLAVCGGGGGGTQDPPHSLLISEGSAFQDARGHATLSPLSSPCPQGKTFTYSLL